MSFRYDAFISYRHAPLDMDIAKRVHRGLETFKVPRAVQKTSGKRRINRVFRDQEELPIGSDLTDNIDKALDESEFLIVICSPRTPGSEWVQKEIESFIAKHGRSHALAILIEGEPSESFPKQLLEDEYGNPVEPLAADVRGETDAERKKKLKTELMRLAAPLLGCSYDDLRQRHRERRLRKAIGMATGIGAVVALLGIAFGIYNAQNAERIRQSLLAKQESQSKYLAEEARGLLIQGDRRAAALVAAEGLPRDNDRPFVPSSAYALSEALHVYDMGNYASFDRVLMHESVVSTFKFNRDGDLITTLDAGGKVYVWNTENGELLYSIVPTVNDYGYIDRPLDALAYGQRIYVAEDKKLTAYGYDGDIQWDVELPGEVSYAQIDELANCIVCTRSDSVSIYSCDDGSCMQTYVSDEGAGFSDPQVFNQDRDKLLVAKIQSYGSTETSVPISMLDLSTGECTDISVDNTYIVNACWTADGNVAVASCDFDALYASREFEARLDVITPDGQVLWSYDFNHMGDYYVRMKSRAYSDDDGYHNDLIMAATDVVYVFDAQSGEITAAMHVDSGVEDMLVSAVGEYVYISKSTEGIAILSGKSGESFDSYEMDTEGCAKKFLICNGVTAFSRYQSAGLQLLKYHVSDTMEEITEYPDNPSAVYTSENESYYAVCYGYGQSRYFEFYDSDNNYVWDSLNLTDLKAEDCGFLDDRSFVILSSDGICYRMDIAKQEIAETDMRFDDSIMLDLALSENSKYAVEKANHDIQVWDVQKDKKSYELRDIDDRIELARVSPTGEYLVACLSEAGVQISHNGGQFKSLDDSIQAIVSGQGKSIAFSDTKVAIACTDGLLRVYDMASGKLLNEIYYVGRSRGFVCFSDDGNKLMLQGDDYRLYIYDLENDRLLFYSTDEYYIFDNFKIDDAAGIISLSSGYGLLLMDKETCQPIAYVDDGMAFFSKKKAIMAAKWRKGYLFKYLESDELLEELEKQFPGETLSDMELITYNID